jgi:type I restriction enzyme S subunit
MCPGAIASSLAIVRAKGELVPEFLLLYFQSELSDQEIRKYDNGTAQPNLSAADLRKFLVPVPPLAVQLELVARAQFLLSKAEVAIESSAKLLRLATALRRCVLRSAFSGQLTGGARV